MIANVGRERFRILKVLEERPVLVCEVEYMDDDDDRSEEAVAMGRWGLEFFRLLVFSGARV
jgi:Lon protease-like protein